MPRMRDKISTEKADDLPRDCGLCRQCEKLAPFQLDRDVEHGVVTISRTPALPYEPLAKLGPDGESGCLWAMDLWGNAYSSRPDRCGVVPWLLERYRATGGVVLFVRPDRPRAYQRKPVAMYVRGAWMQGRKVFVRDGTGRDHLIEE